MAYCLNSGKSMHNLVHPIHHISIMIPTITWVRQCFVCPLQYHNCGGLPCKSVSRAWPGWYVMVMGVWNSPWWWEYNFMPQMTFSMVVMDKLNQVYKNWVLGCKRNCFHNTMPYQLLPLLKHHGPVIISLRTLKQPQPQPPLPPPAQPHLHEDWCSHRVGTIWHWYAHAKIKTCWTESI